MKNMQIKILKKVKTDTITAPKIGEIMEGVVAEKDKNGLFIDLGAKGVGVIFGKEFIEAKNVLKNIKIGDKITAKVVDLETEDGYRELSLVGANQEIAWKELLQAKKQEEVLDATVKAANKGGLILQVMGVDGFLPASQLLPEHYPKVEGADPAKIIIELQKLVGQKIQVKIFDVNPAENKLIFSEKTIRRKKMTDKIVSFKQGDEIEGEISGVTSFGAFLVFDEGIEGLIPASEISAEGQAPSEILKTGQKLKARITEIANNRVYLSLLK